MAKSLRSKWKRKMKAVKRVRYGEKVIERGMCLTICNYIYQYEILTLHNVFEIVLVSEFTLFSCLT